MPINWHEIGSIDGVPPTKHSNKSSMLLNPSKDKPTGFLAGTDLLLTSHFIFTLAFSVITLLFLNRAYKHFVRQRQLFALDVAHSVPARTVLIQNVPPQFQQDRLLSDYFRKLELPVESVNVVRQVGRLADLLQERTHKLRSLETAWAKYLGNPSSVPDYDRETEENKIFCKSNSHQPAQERLVDAGDTEEQQQQQQQQSVRFPSEPLLVPGKKRPTVRPGWFSKPVDALDYYAEQFKLADEAVTRARKGRFRPTTVAFVTFETQTAAQIAAQAVHFPRPNEMITSLAPEPRDVHWTNISLTPNSIWARRAFVLLISVATLFFWGAPVSQLARLLSYDTIEHASPGLAKLIRRFPVIQGLIQTSLPSLALIGFNALLPYLLEWYSIMQGLQAKSWIEYSLLKKYFLFLLVRLIPFCLADETSY